jgi:hypothetical protein
MTDTPSSILLLRLQSTGSNTNLWGGYLNVALQTIEQANKGYQALAVTGDATISWTNYSTGNSLQYGFVKLTGTLSASATLTAPGYPNFLGVWNATGQNVTIMCSAGTGVTIPNGVRTLIYCDGTDYASAGSSWLNTSQSTLTNNGDVVVKTTLQTAIANASIPASAGTVLVDAADASANYLAAKLTAQVTGLTTTQVTGLTSLQIASITDGVGKKVAFTPGNGYVGGFLNGGNKSAQFTPVVGTEYNCDFTSSSWTINLSGMTTPQIGQRIKLNCFGNNQAFLLGTVNSQTNLVADAGFSGELAYSSASWGWN